MSQETLKERTETEDVETLKITKNDNRPLLDKLKWIAPLAIFLFFAFMVFQNSQPILDTSIITSVTKDQHPNDDDSIKIDFLNENNVVKDGYMPLHSLNPMRRKTDKLLIHTWHKGPLPAGYDLLIRSALVTQDLKKSKLILWMSSPWDLSNDSEQRRSVEEFRHTPHGFVEFRLLDIKQLAKDAKNCWQGRPEFMLEKPMIDFGGYTFYSDIIRILLLQIYGGVWIDSDTTFLIDLQILHQKLYPYVVSGRSQDFGNNNFIYVTDERQREVLADLSCEWRYKPNRISRTNYTEDECESHHHVGPPLRWTNFNREWLGYELIRPSLFHGLYHMDVFNYWIWNDGVMKLCLALPGICNHYTLPIGITDSVWMGAGGLYDLCEIYHHNLQGHTSNFEEMMSSTRTDARNISTYWQSQELTKLTLVVHDRKQGCRTTGTTLQGSLKFFSDQVNARMGFDPRRAPIEPLDILGVDQLMLRSRSHNDVAFAAFTLFIPSFIQDQDKREFIRSVYAGVTAWIPHHSVLSKRAFSIKIWFVIELIDSRNNGEFNLETSNQLNGRAVAEAAEEGDILLIPPYLKKGTNGTPTERLRSLKHQRQSSHKKGRASRPKPKKEKKEKKKLEEGVRQLRKSDNNDVIHIKIEDIPPTILFSDLTLFKSGKYDVHQIINPRPELPQMTDRLVPIKKQRDHALDSLGMWGEREFKGDGFVSRAMEFALMKWSLTHESRFIAILHNDHTLLHIPHLYKLLSVMAKGDLSHKTVPLDSFVIALTALQSTVTLNTTDIPTGDFYDRNSRLVSQQENPSIIVQSSHLKDPNSFHGFITTRNLLPYLLSSDNPIKRGMIECPTHKDDNDYSSFAYKEPETIWSYSITKDLESCEDGNRHPLNSRYHSKRQRYKFERPHVFTSIKVPNLIRILQETRSVNFQKCRSESKSILSQIYPEIGTDENKCLQKVQVDVPETTPICHLSEEFKSAISISHVPFECPSVVSLMKILAQSTRRE